jgi:hypothetical protein
VIVNRAQLSDKAAAWIITDRKTVNQTFTLGAFSIYPQNIQFTGICPDIVQFTGISRNIVQFIGNIHCFPDGGCGAI